MDQVSRPFQVMLLLTLAFAALWFVALRPKASEGPPPPPPAPAGSQPAQGKSAIPGPLGKSVDKARTTRSQADADAASRSDRVDAGADPAPTPQNAPATPVVKPPRAPKGAPGQAIADGLPRSSNGVMTAGAAAVGMVSAAFAGAIDDITPVDARAQAVAARLPGPRARPGFGTPRKVRRALARGNAVVLLFYSARSSDDRAVRSELAALDRRGGRVSSWAVSVRGVSRFKNVLRGVQILQSPTAVVLHRDRRPVVFAGYTSHGELDQAAAVALRRR